MGVPSEDIRYYVAGENGKMLWMASEFGFSFEHVAVGVVRITALL
jgi:hypothetical protein